MSSIGIWIGLSSHDTHVTANLWTVSQSNIMRYRLTCQIKRKREKWSGEWFVKRNQYSCVNLVKELKIDPQDYCNYLRMDDTTNLKLLSTVITLIHKRVTRHYHEKYPLYYKYTIFYISPHERLKETYFLQQGERTNA